MVREKFSKSRNNEKSHDSEKGKREKDKTVPTQLKKGTQGKL